MPRSKALRNHGEIPGARTDAGDALTELILEIFRANGQLLALGNRQLAPFGLSSAKWQVMGAVAASPLTAAQAGRRMGLTRQGVLWVAKRLVRTGLAEFIPNPDHRSARLLRLTSRGARVLEQISRGQAQWANEVAAAVGRRKLELSLETLRALRSALARQNSPED